MSKTFNLKLTHFGTYKFIFTKIHNAFDVHGTSYNYLIFRKIIHFIEL